jgi:uncharacterized protein YqjF (DUF2071 family)
VAGDFDHGAVNDAAHRPWPMPAGPWAMTQTWNDLLFAHWPLPATSLRRLVPPAFELDLFGDTAWLGVVPFRMTNVSVRGVPPLPWLSEFAELNVRTYVRVADKPGVFFFSLDAERLPAVIGARALLNLPYHGAEMSVRASGTGIHYTSRRNDAPHATFEATYQPDGPPSESVPGELSYFLTERYCLYALDGGGSPYRLEIHHRPWALQPARAQIQQNTMAPGLTQPFIGAPLLHFAKRQDVVAWLPESLPAPQ